MPSRSTTSWRLLLAVALVVLSGCGVEQTHPAASAPGGTDMMDVMDLPDVTLTDGTGQSYNVRDTPTTPIVVVAFGYTRCRPQCADSINQLTKALAESPTRVRDRVTALFITVDPTRDGPAQVASFVGKFAPDMVGLTGTEGQIRGLADHLGVAVSAPQRDKSGGYYVGHGAHMLVFGPDRHAELMWRQGVRAAEIAHDLDVLVRKDR